MKIFIEHYPKDEEFAKFLAKRLKSIKNVSINTYQNLLTENPEMDNKKLSKELDKYDIIIPIVAQDYSTTEYINDKFDELTENPEKIIFPIIYDESHWSSMNWVVKSKVFPESGFPYISLDEKSKANTIARLVNTIESVIAQKNQEVPVINSVQKNIVFISHSHDDADFAELLKLQFEKNDINAWIDAEKLKIGQDWRQEIDDGIVKSIAVIVIMTPNAKNSEYVTYEWAFAWGNKIPIFPIMLKQTPLHPRLESLQYLDFTNRITRPWKQLIDSIKKLQK